MVRKKNRGHAAGCHGDAAANVAAGKKKKRTKKGVKKVDVQRYAGTVAGLKNGACPTKAPAEAENSVVTVRTIHVAAKEAQGEGAGHRCGESDGGCEGGNESSEGVASDDDGDGWIEAECVALATVETADGSAECRFFFLADFSEHADGERRGPWADLRGTYDIVS